MVFKDNTTYIAPSAQLLLSDCLALERIANRNISSLISDRGGNLLVYPESFSQCPDKISDLAILKIQKTAWKNGQCIGANLQIGNLAGFIGLGSQNLEIKSRFSENNDCDYFLYYMLERVLCLNILDMPFGTNRDDTLDLLILLFPKMLNDALAQGIYKEYCRSDYNDSNIRGPIDVCRHISKNIPFSGRVAYHTREFSYDNSVTELVRHTIEFIRWKKLGRIILEGDRTTREGVAAIVAATPNYSAGMRNKVIRSNLKIIPHPFFSRYAPLQRVCLRILRGERIKYEAENENQIYGLLFDVSYLWEEYLAKILMPFGFKHPNNRGKTGQIWLTVEGKHPRYPDFFLKDSGGIVVDAKYKKDIDSVLDVNQMVTYMYRLKAHRGVFVKPCNLPESLRENYLQGYGADVSAGLHVYSFLIPKTTANYAEFKKQMIESERRFKEYIGSMCDRLGKML